VIAGAAATTTGAIGLGALGFVAGNLAGGIVGGAKLTAFSLRTASKIRITLPP
jgi:hypothetical protein